MSHSSIVRKEIRDLTEFELQEYRYAFHLLFKDGSAAGDAAAIKSTVDKMTERDDVFPVWSVDDITSLHSEWASLHAAHCHTGNQSFLAWHRRYMAILETALRRVYLEDWARESPDNQPEDYDPESMALHYWNYTKSNTRDALVVPREFTDDATINTHRQAGMIPNPLFFANRGNNYVSNTNNVLQDAGDDGMRSLVAAAMRQSTFADFHPTLEFLPHNRMHVLIDNFMANPSTAALDPIFAAHHSNIDRLWWEWQRAHVGGDTSASLVQEMDEALALWFGNKALHWRGLLDSPIAPLLGDETTQERFLRNEVLHGTPGVVYSSQANHEPEWGAQPVTMPDTVYLTLPHYEKIAGSYDIHVFMFKDGETRPRSRSAAALQDFGSRLLCHITTFGRSKCKCTPEELEIKTEFRYRVNVTDRLKDIATRWELSLEDFETGALPSDVKLVMVPVPAKRVDSINGAAGAGAGDGDGSHAHCEALASLSAIHIKEGNVSRFPWEPELEVFRYEDIVARLGVFTQLAPYQLGESKGSDSEPPLPAYGWPESSAAAEARTSRHKKVVGALQYVEEWDSMELHKRFATCGAGVRVGIVDSGIDLSHHDLDDLEAAVKRSGDARLRWRDFTDAKSKVPCDKLGHGTLTATLLAGDIDGICPDATLFVARVFKTRRRAEWGDIEAALKWLVRSSVHIIVLPLGGSGRNRAVTRQIYKAIAEGIIVLAGAGTEVNDGTVMFPAKLPGVLAVAATMNAADCTKAGSEALSGRDTGPSLGISFMAPGVCCVGMAGDQRIAAGSSVAVAQAAGVVALTLGAANSNLLAFADRDLRGISNSCEWLDAAGLLEPVSMRQKVLSPAKVHEAMAAAGVLAHVAPKVEHLTISGGATHTAPFTAGTRLRIAGRLTLRARDSASAALEMILSGFTVASSVQLAFQQAFATTCHGIALSGPLPHQQDVAMQTLENCLGRDAELGLDRDRHGRPMLVLRRSGSAPVVLVKVLD